jgi:hypothetical protein
VTPYRLNELKRDREREKTARIPRVAATGVEGISMAGMSCIAINLGKVLGRINRPRKAGWKKGEKWVWCPQNSQNYPFMKLWYNAVFLNVRELSTGVLKPLWIVFASCRIIHAALPIQDICV